MNAESVVVDSVDYEAQESAKEDVTENMSDAPVEDNAEEYVVPERFRGKEMKDVISSYENLEKKMQEQGEELGQLRPLRDYADVLLQQNKQVQQPEPQVEADEADFFDDPRAAVRGAIAKDPTIQQMQEQMKMQSQFAAQQKFAQAHPDYREIVGDSGFQEWVNESPVRTRLFAEANANYDFDAGNELLMNWKDRKSISKTKAVDQQEEQSRKEGLKAGKGVSKASGESTAGKKIYRRGDLIRLKQTDPARYDMLADEIYQAYQEGRVK